MLRTPMRLLPPGLLLACLTACAQPSNKDVPSWPQDGLLTPCLSLAVPSAGDTNGTLSKGFLDARNGMQVCQGIVKAVHDQRPTEAH